MVAKLIESFDILEECKKQEEAILFKHSLTCGVSANALNRFEDFMKDHPDFPCYILFVQNSREISNLIANESGIPHQSPQALYFEAGEIVKNESHGRITKELLEEWIK